MSDHEEETKIDCLDLTLVEEKVMLKDRTGKEALFIIRELDGDQRDGFTNLLTSRTRYVDGKPHGLKDSSGIYARMIHMALWDDKGQKVPEAMINKWPARVQEALVKKIVAISGLTALSEKLAKND